MKKFLKFAFVAISVLFLSQSAFADKNTTSCRVYGEEGLVVTVNNPVATVNDFCKVQVKLSLNRRPSTDKVGVSVEVYDSKMNNIGNDTIYLPNGNVTNGGYGEIEVPKEYKNQTVFVRLSSASCI